MNDYCRSCPASFMPSPEATLQRYSTPFHRHLSFFDKDDDGFIHFGDSLRGNLSIGLDFPVALVLASSYHIVHGNTRSALFGPFNPIEIVRVRTSRDMLERVDVEDLPARGIPRKDLVRLAQPSGFMDRVHVNGLWAFAANRQGLLSAYDIRLYQQGVMLFELERRRKELKDNRDNVLPLYRGGPISVTGHSWFVDKLFGVKVYQQYRNGKRN